MSPRQDSTLHSPLLAPQFSTAEIAAGTEWIVEAFECDEQRLCSLEQICQICNQVVFDLGLNVLGQPQTHRFAQPGGVTALYMLTESHLACHTYPEFRLATFNLYCCRARASWNWSDELQSSLLARRVETRRIDRGIRLADHRQSPSTATLDDRERSP